MNRNSYFDFARGLAILLVVYGHCIPHNEFVYLAMFNMHVFMYLSGFLFFNSVRNYSAQKIIKRVSYDYIFQL